MIADETHVYWQNVDGQVVRAKIDSGEIETMAGGGQLSAGSPCALALASGTVYSAGDFVVHATDVHSNGDGTFGTSSEHAAEGIHTTNGLAADADQLYVAEEGATASPPSGAIIAVALTPSHPRHYVSNGLVSPSRLALDATSVYWVTGDGAVQSAPKKTSGSAVQAQTLPAIDSSQVRVVATGSGRLFIGTGISVVSTDTAGGSQRTLATDAQGLYPTAFATDGTTLWWAASATISKVATTGGSSSVVAQETDGSIVGFAANAKYVFWSNSKNEVWVAPR
ncbi:hypothetical protein AKJ09_01581 [Labilithrix luteola]|uniref:Uncharacterized protein n=1 Tax=Labilithrix luteola TaxID=1391654 RepID=A0A0K1PN25_9BACT|nr:hypothetical protein [Labilithrix luteola]AKU94917.1 hypothetical protein AKJ09_01581 [Labilithrix luteola]